MNLEELKEQIKKTEEEIKSLPSFKKWYNFIYNSKIENKKFSLEAKLSDLIKEKEEAEALEKIKNEAIDYLNNIQNIETDISASLSKNEYCLMIIDNVEWFEIRKERGAEGWKKLYQGILYFTNERLILKTDNETKNIKIDTIIDVEIWKDGVELSKIKGKNILLGNMEIVDVYKTTYFINTARKGGITINNKTIGE